MCFSATGSFAASGLLAGIGLATLVRNRSPRHRMFAAIPLLFAAQQAAEGIVWVTLSEAALATLHRAAVNVFLSVALMVWPLWLPLALQRIERDPVRRRVLMGLLCAGVAVTGYAIVLLIRWQPIAQVAGHSIRYAYAGEPGWPSPLICLLVYAIPTVAPFFVSSANLARTIGLALIASLLAAVIVERDALTSVWCFFAALLSGLVFLAAEREQQFLAAQRRVGTRAGAPA
jgi:hypothetical protein